MDEWVLVECPVCDGAGEWDEGPLAASPGALEPDYRQVICPECNGTGRAFVAAESIDMDDLADRETTVSEAAS